MNKNKIEDFLSSFYQIPSLLYLFKWILICLTLGAIVGSISAFFLFSLDWATNWREAHLWIIALLPVGGFMIVLSYHLYGKGVVKGNSLLLEEFHSPKKIIPLRMAPLVLLLLICLVGLRDVRVRLCKLEGLLRIDLQKY